MRSSFTHTKILLSRQRKLNKRQKEGVNEGDLSGAKAFPFSSSRPFHLQRILVTPLLQNLDSY